ncbi:terminase gpP N-terminus-related DNA-binding protein [Corynebacterium variabile]|uniref:terminase gpP N-terminus-related DNA-binding protein n=1 Tax=Corynebacterium variabile TaxID=1727 RepID=UPI003FD41DA1
MSRVPPIKQEALEKVRGMTLSACDTCSTRASKRLKGVKESAGDFSPSGLVDGMKALMKSEHEAAVLRRRIALMLYSAGATPRQIAEELGRQGYSVDHQTIYRWVAQAAEEAGTSLDEMRETPKH